MFAATNIDYDFSQRVRGLACGGIGAIHMLVNQLQLADAIELDNHRNGTTVLSINA